MKTITVNASSSYNVIIGRDLLENAGEFCVEALGSTCKLCVLTDDNVAPLYLEKVKRSLSLCGFDVIEFVIENGEKSKSASSLISLVEFMAKNEMTRKDALIALGGGVVGDLGGFAAAVYLRGIRFIQMPTTLLAAVDSSVGGKTAVDISAGKNLMGAFLQPSLVICDYSTLSTLNKEIFSDGCAEIIKYGMINDRPFFNMLKEGIADNLEEVIAASVANKAKIVEKDEFDKGQRQLLNLGHTVGHAIELCSNYTISHGSAVAIGMVIITRAATKTGICPESDLYELISLLDKEGLPTSCDFSVKELTQAALNDKKRKGDEIDLILPYSIGDSRIYSIPVSELEEIFIKGLTE